MSSEVQTKIYKPEVRVYIPKLGVSGEIPADTIELRAELNAPSSASILFSASEDNEGKGKVLEIKDLIAIVTKLQGLINSDPKGNTMDVSVKYGSDVNITASFIITTASLTGNANSGSVYAEVTGVHVDALADGVEFNIYKTAVIKTGFKERTFTLDASTNTVLKKHSGVENSIGKNCINVCSTLVNDFSLEDNAFTPDMTEEQKKVLRNTNDINKDTFKYLKAILENSSDSTDFLNGNATFSEQNYPYLVNDIVMSFITSDYGGFYTMLNTIASKYMLNYIPNFSSNAGKFENIPWELSSPQGALSCSVIDATYALGQPSTNLLPVKSVSTHAQVAWMPKGFKDTNTGKLWGVYEGKDVKEGRSVAFAAPSVFAATNVLTKDAVKGGGVLTGDTKRQDPETVQKEVASNIEKTTKQSLQELTKILEKLSELYWKKLVYGPSTAFVLGFPKNIDIELLGKVVSIAAEPGGRMFTGLFSGISYSFQSNGNATMKLTFNYVGAK